ncbi:MAG: chondroitinase-B domain-containing protein, partial [Myxococcota bacterium]
AWCLATSDCTTCPPAETASRLMAADACGRRPHLEGDGQRNGDECCYEGARAACDVGARAVVEVASMDALEEALDEALPGTEIVVRDGTYTGRWTLRAQGEETAPVLVRAETPGGVVLTGVSSRLEITGSRWLILEGFHLRDLHDGDNALVVRASSDCIVRHTLFENTDPDARRQKSFVRILDTSKRNTLEHAAFFGTTDWAVQIWGYIEKDGPDTDNTDNVVRFCHFVDADVKNGNSELLQVGQGGADDIEYRALIENNLFERSRGTSELISNKTSGNVYRNNTFRDVDDRFTLRGGEHCTIEGNWFFQSSGLRIHGSHHRVLNNYFEGYHPAEPDEGGLTLRAGNRRTGEASGSHDAADHVLIAHNTFFNAASSGYAAMTLGDKFGSGTFDVAPEGLNVVGNVIQVDEGVALDDRSSLGTLFADNVVWTTDGATAGANPSGVAVDDPAFEATAMGYRQPTASHLERSGDAPARDIHGAQRPSAKRLGADQMTCVAAGFGPLTAAEVGPSWWTTSSSGG